MRGKQAALHLKCSSVTGSGCTSGAVLLLRHTCQSLPSSFSPSLIQFVSQRDQINISAMAFY